MRKKERKKRGKKKSVPPLKISGFATALVHLASLPVDVFMSDFARHEVYKNWRKRSGDENVRAGQAIYTHVFHLFWRRLKSVDAIQNFGAEDRCDERGQGKN